MKTSRASIVLWATLSTANEIPCTEGNALIQKSVSTVVIQDDGATELQTDLDIDDDSSIPSKLLEAESDSQPMPGNCDPEEAIKQAWLNANGNSKAFHEAMNKPFWMRRHTVYIDGTDGADGEFHPAPFIDRRFDEIMSSTGDDGINECKRMSTYGLGDQQMWATWKDVPIFTRRNPVIKVCGNSLKITLFHDHRCRYPLGAVGSCDAFPKSGHYLPPSTCCQNDPSDFRRARPNSYMVESCGPYADGHSLVQQATHQLPLEAIHPLGQQLLAQPVEDTNPENFDEGKTLEMLTVAQVENKLNSTKLDNNQKVYIQNQPVLGDGSGQGALGVCRELARQHVENPDAPAVRVCGTGIKATFYLRGRCEAYYEHSYVIGKCDSGMAPSTCDSFSPAQDPRFGHYQSYLIEQCPPR